VHPYSRDFNLTAWVHVVLAAIAVGAYLGLLGLPAPLKELTPFARYWNFTTPLTAFSIFLVVETWFERAGWKLLSRIKFLHLEDFAGSYAGELHAEGTRPARKHQAKVQIKQTWSRIEIDFESEGATSKSFSAAVVRNRQKHGQIELVYNYYAEPKHRGDFPAHYGTAMFKLGDHGTSDLSGNYYTEQDRNSYGSIAMTRTPHRASWMWQSIFAFLVVATIAGAIWYYFALLRH
jgi:hypothetical protein